MKASCLYGESQSRIVVTVDKANYFKLLELTEEYKINTKKIGETVKDKFVIENVFEYKLSEIKDVAYNFSMIFQIIDDFEDVKEDKPHNNYVLFYGKEKATRDVNEYLTILKLKLNNVNLSSPFFYSILNYFDKKILQYTNGV